MVLTTNLAAETGKNTSAASSFGGTANGNIATGANVSKVPSSTLLYPGAMTKIYAHLMPWFGFGSHFDIGYKSDDPAQVKAQVTDMLSRGIAGMIIDWYGPGSDEDSTALAIRPEAESRNGQFEFAIMEDKGSKSLKNCGDCTSGVITDLTYIYNTYESSPAYVRWNGRPVVFFFDVESLSVNWTTVRSSAPGNPILIFQNSGALTSSKPYSDGGFAWVMPHNSNENPSDFMALGYLDDFYSTAVSNSDHLPFAGAYKGFNDAIAGWSPAPPVGPRVMDQQCGQTWLKSMAELSKYYSASRQLAAIQLVTWNDYEEGTEIETGIDNCLSISAGSTGSVVNWSVSGDEGTLDHYTVFISADGQNLMSLGDYPTSVHSLDVAPFGFAAGDYRVYVKAVGKPSIVNHMSAAVSYISSGGPPTVGFPDFSIITPGPSATVARGQSATFMLNLVPGASGAGSPVLFSCSGLPAGATCNFNPASVTLGRATVPVSAVITTSSAMARNGFSPTVIYAMTLPGFGMVLLQVTELCKRKWLLILIAASMILLVAGCGGGAANTPGRISGTPAGTYTVTITATSGTAQHSTSVSLTVQ